MPKLSGTKNVPVARSRYQTSNTPIPESTDEPQQDHFSESKQLLSNSLAQPTRHERSTISEHVSGSAGVSISISELPSIGPKKHA